MKSDPKANHLRRDSTAAERRLWSALRSRRFAGYKFRRQHPIGHFIVDFACIEQKLIIEADGGQHADNSADKRRTEWLNSQGWHVVRFWNNDILANINGVLDTVMLTLESGAYPHPPVAMRRAPPSPALRERG